MKQKNNVSLVGQLDIYYLYTYAFYQYWSNWTMHRSSHVTWLYQEILDIRSITNLTHVSGSFLSWKAEVRPFLKDDSVQDDWS